MPQYHIAQFNIAKMRAPIESESMAGFVSRFGISRLEADEYYRVALDFYQKNNLDQAIHNINSAIELLPNRAEYFAARGYFRLEDGDPKRAEPDFDKAIRGLERVKSRVNKPAS